ncbi:MAG: hypothetical protein ACREYF_01230 [Gammaproteobacteria bacterium]
MYRNSCAARVINCLTKRATRNEDATGQFAHEERLANMPLLMTRCLDIHPQIREIIGNFASLYPVEIDFRVDDSFAGRARRVQEQVIRDAQHLQWGGMQVMRALNRHTGDLGRAPILLLSAAVC